MIKVHCRNEITLYEGLNYVSYSVELYDNEGNLQNISETPLVYSSEPKIDVSDYSIMKIDSNVMNLGDEFELEIHCQNESVTKQIRIARILHKDANDYEEEVIVKEEPIEQQILDKVNLLVELQADILGGAI